MQCYLKLLYLKGLMTKMVFNFSVLNLVYSLLSVIFYKE